MVVSRRWYHLLPGATKRDKLAEVLRADLREAQQSVPVDTRRGSKTAQAVVLSDYVDPTIMTHDV